MTVTPTTETDYTVDKGLDGLGAYAGINDNTQHWIKEPVDEANDQYRLKSLNNGLHMGVEDGKLVAVAADKAATVTFRPGYQKSPLYKLSISDGPNTGGPRREQTRRGLMLYARCIICQSEQKNTSGY